MRFIITFLAAVALTTAAVAQRPASDQDHAAHHPEAASAPAASAKKPSASPKTQATKPKPPATPGGPGMGSDMHKMHEHAHKPGGMHDQMHGKDAKMMGGGAMPGMPAASAPGK